MLVPMVTLGISIAQVLLRFADLNPVADGLGDASTGLKAWLSKRSSKEAGTRALGEAIAAELEDRLASSGGAHLKTSMSVTAAHFVVDESTEVSAAARNVATVFHNLPDEGLVAAVRGPEHFHAYLLRHGGQKLLQSTSSVASPFAERLLKTCSELFVEYAPKSSNFPPAALASLIRSADELVAGQQHILDLQREMSDDQQEVLERLGAIQHGLLKPHVIDPHATGAALLASRIRREELEPDILPSMRRAELVDAISRRPTALQAIIGDGGLGKSTLAGQLYDQLHDTRPTILVNCSALRNTHRLESVELLDLALGEQVGVVQTPLSTVLAQFTERPSLVLDTLDIVLREENADDIAWLLDKYSLDSDVVVICRSREWHDLIAPTWNDGVVVAHNVPMLNRDEITEWARAYTHEESIDPAKAETFLSAIAATAEVPRGVNVLGVPLRLAMACRLYAATGGLPSDLTATRLYDEYWSRRVATGRDGRRKTRSARAAEQAALSVARSIWHASDERFIEDVSWLEEDPEAITGLLSEGVLVEVGYRVHYFHQTFAEFAVARYLAASGDQEDLRRLGHGLRSQTSGYWGIVNHLVHEQLTETRLRQVISIVPRSVEGVRTIVTAVYEHGDVVLVSDVLDEIARSDPAALAAASDLLKDAPPPCRTAAATALQVLLSDVPVHLTTVVRSLGVLIAAEPDGSAALLTSTLRLLADRRRGGDEQVVSEIRRLLDAVLTNGSPTVSLMTAAINEYAALPDPARRSLGSAVLDDTDPCRRSDFLDAALRDAVPEGAVETYAVIAIREWTDKAARRRRGWTSWHRIATADLPRRWDAVQVRLLAAVAADSQTRTEMISECLRPTRETPRDRLVNAVRFVADEMPDQVTAEILRIGVTDERPAVTALSQLALQLQPSASAIQSRELVAVLQPHAHVDPRRTWPAIVKLSAADSKMLDSSLRRLHHAVSEDHSHGWGVVVASALAALVQVRTPQQLQGDIDVIDFLLEVTPNIDAQRQASFVGSLAAVSTRARAQIDREIDSDRTNAQRTLVKTLIAGRAHWDPASWSEALPWFVDLLRVRRDGAVISLATSLVDDVRHASWTERETSAVVDRLVTALNLEHDPQTSGSLVQLLAVIAHDAAISARPSAEQVAGLVDTYRECLDRASAPDRRGALYGQHASLLSSVAKVVLPFPDVFAHAVELSVEIDVSTIAGRARRSLARLIGSMVRSDPMRWAELEALWPRVPDANRWALAETALTGLVTDRDEVATRLARREDCPPEVAAYLLRRLGG